jgi:hypothetical protein
MYHKVGMYEISDWVNIEDSTMVCYKAVKEGTILYTWGIRIYDRGNSFPAAGIRILIDALSLHKIYRSIYDHYDVDTQFNTIEDAKNHVELFLDKFQKLKMFL